MSRRIVTFLLLALAVSLVKKARADDSKTLDRQLNKTYKGKTLTLRKFYCGQVLHFNAEGGVLAGNLPGPWTVCGKVKVKHIKQRDQTLEIEGERTLVFYGGKGVQERSLDGGPVDIEVQLSANPASVEATQPHLAKIFLATNENLVDFVPDYWRPYLAKERALPVDNPLPGRGTGTPPSFVKPPVVIHKPQPQYSEVARNARLQGRVVLWIVVDAQGNVGKLQIVKPLGLGLDEDAVEVTQTWKFKPATRNGVPTAVRVMVETEFRLH